MKTVFTNGNPILGVRGTKITAELMTALNSPSFSTQEIDGHFDIAIEDVNTYGAPNSRAALDAAIAAAGASQKILLLRTGEWPLGSTPLTVPTNVHLAWAPGAYFSGTADITINGQFFNIPLIDPILTSGTITYAAGLEIHAFGTLKTHGNVDMMQNSTLNQNTIFFDTTPSAITPTEGALQWNPTDGTLNLGMSAGAVTQQIGQELFLFGRNVSGSTIPDATPVYISGRTGNKPNIWPAKSDSETTAAVVGITTQEIASPANGYVTTFGYVRGIKTNYTGIGDWGTTWMAGDRLYVSKTVAGQLTNVEPATPHHSDCVATVEMVHSNLGSILVNINKHGTLQELTDVNGTALTTDGQVPAWDNTNKYFDFGKNVNDYLKKDGSDTGATGQDQKFSNGIVLPKTTNVGIKVDVAAPTFGWRDLLCTIQVRPSAGGGAAAQPDYVAYRGSIFAWRFGTIAPNNHLHEAFVEIHIPHDYVPGTDFFIHPHWSQIVVDTGGTAGVPGVAKWYFDMSYAKGHGTPGGAADPFNAPITTSVTQQGSTTQYGHMIADLQATNAGGDATHIDRARIEVDGILLLRIYRDPGDAADTLNQDTFLHFVDMHYQSTNMATKQKSPNFYV